MPVIPAAFRPVRAAAPADSYGSWLRQALSSPSPGTQSAGGTLGLSPGPHDYERFREIRFRSPRRRGCSPHLTLEARGVSARAQEPGPPAPAFLGFPGGLRIT